MSLPRCLLPEDIALLLSRADAEVQSAKCELNRAIPIVKAAGLTVHSSVLDKTFYAGGGDHGAPQSYVPGVSSVLSNGTSSSKFSSNANISTNDPNTCIDQNNLEQEAAAALQARQRYNPIRGRLRAHPFVLSTTGGHSNTDHVIHQNPNCSNGSIDKLSEFKRRMKRRVRETHLERRCTDAWDLPRIPGGRRRRIKRDLDAPTAPPRPPDGGYVIYVSQMTTKLRYENPKRRHDQIMAVKRISRMWNKMAEKDRAHYNQLAKDAKAEYIEKMREFRATGSWKPFKTIDRLGDKRKSVSLSCIGGSEYTCNSDKTRHENDEYDYDKNTGHGPWVRIPYDKKNDLEKEIETYDRVVFPPRPPEMNGEYKRKLEESKEKRKRKNQAERRKYY